MIPARIPTGYKSRTIPSPASLAQELKSYDTYQGPVSGYNFLKQADNHARLKAVLADSKIKFTEVSSVRYDGDRGYNQRFVVMTNCPGVFWYKYVGFIAQSGQNHIFVHGHRIKVTHFLMQPHQVQDALLKNNLEELERWHPGLLAQIDEASWFWN